MLITLMNHETMLLKLLHAALNTVPADTYWFKSASISDWELCYNLAKQQGVIALAWDGIITLPTSLLPPKNLKIKWAYTVENCEKRYNHFCETATDITEYYVKHNIATIILKGVGFSKYYPKPEHREGGDVDIYTYSANPTVLSNEAANKLADQLMIEKGITVSFFRKKHSEFKYHEIPIENHKMFFDVKEFKLAARFETLLKPYLHPLEIEILEGKNKILIPNPSFNTIFISFHAIQHYGAGLCLHHLCDWACLLKHEGLHIPPEFKDEKYVNIVNAMTEFCNLYLGTNIPIRYSNKRLEKLLFEIFRNPYKDKIQSNNCFIILALKIKRFLRYRIVLKELLGESITKGLWKSIVFHLKKPKTILGFK